MAKPCEFFTRKLQKLSPFLQFLSLHRVFSRRRLSKGYRVNLSLGQQSRCQHFLPPAIEDASCARSWYAVFTIPQHEKAVARHLDVREIESFLPTYDAVRNWKNRQRVKVVLPLFPTYLFVRINPQQRVKVLQAPGVLQIVGNGRESVPLLESEIDFLRSGFCRQRVEPFRELVVGARVRIKSGIMQGIEGTLVRKSDTMRFVLTLKLINQHAAVQVDAEDLEPIVA
jgi:transcription antitermination factor NusG